MKKVIYLIAGMVFATMGFTVGASAKTWDRERAIKYAVDGEKILHPAVKNCLDCHGYSKTRHSMGPSLWNLKNRVAGTANPKAMSKVFKSADWKWTEANVRSMMCDPQETVKRLSGNPKASTRMLYTDSFRHKKYGEPLDPWYFVCDKETQDIIFKVIGFPID